MLVLDANVFLSAAASIKGLQLLDDELIGPPLLWPEARSALHVSLWRGLISEELARHSLALLESKAVTERRHRRLGIEAWRIADQLDWAKTYDAEYLALALLLECPLATFDRRVQQAAERVNVLTVTPS